MGGEGGRGKERRRKGKEEDGELRVEETREGGDDKTMEKEGGPFKS